MSSAPSAASICASTQCRSATYFCKQQMRAMLITQPRSGLRENLERVKRLLARTVDGDDHAAGVSGTIGCQKDGHVGDFAWPGGAPERGVARWRDPIGACVRSFDIYRRGHPIYRRAIDGHRGAGG